MSYIHHDYYHLLHAGSEEHYLDPILYDYEYRRRRSDVRYYRAFAEKLATGNGLRILELGCGTGRLLVPLIRDGYSVVGVDRSWPMLYRCKQRLAKVAKKKQSRAHLIYADFRDLPISPMEQGKFPLILCPFNAFMHLYTRKDVEMFLSQVKHHLAEGGYFVFDVLHPDIEWLCKTPDRRYAKTRFTHPETKESLIYSTNHIYDPVRQIAFIRIFYDTLAEEQPSSSLPKVQKMIHLTQRQFFPAELEDLLYYNGFTIEQKYGDFRGEAFAPDSPYQILTTRLSS